MALSMVKNASDQKTDNTFTLTTFQNQKLSCWVKKYFLVKKIHNIEIVFFVKYSKASWDTVNLAKKIPCISKPCILRYMAIQQSAKMLQNPCLKRLLLCSKCTVYLKYLHKYYMVEVIFFPTLKYTVFCQDFPLNAIFTLFFL